MLTDIWLIPVFGGILVALLPVHFGKWVAVLTAALALGVAGYVAYSFDPGAHGYHLGGTAGSFEGDNIEFADGPFLYLVGNGWRSGGFARNCHGLTILVPHRLPAARPRQPALAARAGATDAVT